MGECLVHSGPDDGGAWADTDAGVALVHRRLAIIDLSPTGRQPIESPDGRYVIVYNGETYNHGDLRPELETTGPIEWPGHSGTETLVYGIARWRLEATLRRCVGMFAFAVWDRLERALSLARDRIGEEPLFYGWFRNGLVFGSALKALRAAPGFNSPVDTDMLSLYLRFNYVPAPWTILQHIHKLKLGVIVTLNRSALASSPDTPPASGRPSPTEVTCRRYWSLKTNNAPGVDPTMTETEALAGLEVRLTDAIRLQTVADVPVGAFLTGGVDSSAVVALRRNVTDAELKTFTIGFAEAGFDEAPHARAIAKHLATDHTEMYVDAEQVRALIPDLPNIYDEPFADSSQILTVLLSRLTRRSVTVALSGDSGDELFCGNNRYRVSRRTSDALARLPAPLRAGLGNVLTVIEPTSWGRLATLLGVPRMSQLGDKVHKVGRLLRTLLGAVDVYRELSEEWSGCLPLTFSSRLAAVDAPPAARVSAPEQMMHWDKRSYLHDNSLVKVDRAAMAKSLETRVPLLDHRVVEHAKRMPLAIKQRIGQGKWALRRILYRYGAASANRKVQSWICNPHWRLALWALTRLGGDTAVDRRARRAARARCFGDSSALGGALGGKARPHRLTMRRADVPSVGAGAVIGVCRYRASAVARGSVLAARIALHNLGSGSADIGAASSGGLAQQAVLPRQMTGGVRCTDLS